MTDVDRSSRNRMTRFAEQFFEGESLFARFGRAVCRAEALSRKEFFETWEVAERLRRYVRGKPVVEAAAGHGLLSMLLVILEDSIPSATCIDLRQPPSHQRLLRSLQKEWPRLEGRVRFEVCRLQQYNAPPEAWLVSVHACGVLTDQVLDQALSVHCSVAVLPCCHDLSESDDGGMSAWMEPELAIDAVRAEKLRRAGYDVRATTIPEDITPRNRLLIGAVDPRR